MHAACPRGKSAFSPAPDRPPFSGGEGGQFSLLPPGRTDRAPLSGSPPRNRQGARRRAIAPPLRAETQSGAPWRLPRPGRVRTRQNCFPPWPFSTPRGCGQAAPDRRRIPSEEFSPARRARGADGAESPARGCPAFLRQWRTPARARAGRSSARNIPPPACRQRAP